MANAKTYKFNPEDFVNIPLLTDELVMLHSLCEEYHADRSIDNKYKLRNQLEDVFFLIKRRELDGSIDPVTAQEIRDYLEELASD